MRENRTSGSEGRETGNSTGLPYPYQELDGLSLRWALGQRGRAHPHLSTAPVSALVAIEAYFARYPDL